MEGLDFAEVKGQEATKRGLLVAAAGEHNILMVGPPGVGKTCWPADFQASCRPLTSPRAWRLPGSRASWGRKSRTVWPARALSLPSPHHQLRGPGGGRDSPQARRGDAGPQGSALPGRVSRVQPQGSRGLREPLEEGRITVSRSAGTVTFPARFLLVAAMNPCPCGYLGHRGALALARLKPFEFTASGFPDRSWIAWICSWRWGAFPWRKSWKVGDRASASGAATSGSKCERRGAFKLSAGRAHAELPGAAGQAPCPRMPSRDGPRQAPRGGGSSGAFGPWIHSPPAGGPHCCGPGGARWVEARHLSEALHYRETLAASVGEAMA